MKRGTVIRSALWLWLSAALLLTAAPVLAHSADELAELHSSHYAMMGWAGLVALVICVVHLTSPRLRPFLGKHEAAASSLAGGMAVAYVFVHLMAELEEGRECVGERIHFIVLAGFLAFYGFEHVIRKKFSSQASGMTFRLRLLFAWAYSWLVIYAMPPEVKASGLHTLPILAAIGLHLLYTDFELGSSHPGEFDSWGRYALATAPIVGWLVDSFTPPVDVLCHVGTAILAGAIIYNVFKRELPEHKKSSFLLLLVGVLAYLAFDVAARGL